MPGAWDTEEIKTWSQVPRGYGRQRYSTPAQRKGSGQAAREHRGGVQPDRELREGFSDERVLAEALLECGRQD